MTDAPEIADPFTGEVIDRDDVATLRATLAAIEEFWRPYGRQRRRILERLGELEEYTLPRRAINRTETQEKIHRCPRCRTAFTLPGETGAAASSTNAPT